MKEHSSTTKRGLVGIAALAITGLILSGCSAAEEPATGGDKNAAAEITYGIWNESQLAAIEANIAGFNEEYPNVSVKVNITPFDQYWTKLQTQGISETLPDLFWMNGPNFQLYAANGLLEPITPLVEDGSIDLANYPAPLVDLYSLDGVSYGVPKDFDTIGVWYNKDLFARAGVAEPADDWTWDDFRTTAKAITEALSSEGIYGVAVNTQSQAGYYNAILQAGGSILSKDGSSGFDTPEADEGISFLADLIADGSSPSIQQLTDMSSIDWFKNGKAAMVWHGSWQAKGIRGSVVGEFANAAPLPAGERQATIVHGLTTAVSAFSENKWAAQAFQSYLASENAQIEQGNLAGVIPAFNGTQQSFIDSVPEYDLQVFLDALDYSFPYPVTVDTAAWASLEGPLLAEAFSGARPVSEVNAELAAKINAILLEQ